MLVVISAAYCKSVKDVIIIKPKVFSDERGCFFESYSKRDYEKEGITEEFMQDNQSFSKKGVLRGLHFQKNHGQAKLVRVIQGMVLDVFVDIRRESPDFLRWGKEVLSDENGKCIYLPKGFAHGFLTLSETALFAYKCTDYYDKDDQSGIIWNDSFLGIDWGIENGFFPILSEKDKNLMSVNQLISLGVI